MPELIFIGLGLYDSCDISLKGLSAAKTCDTLFLESYTSRLMGTTQEELEAIFERGITALDRTAVEAEEVILQAAREGTAGLLVGGDPLSATTHQELRVSAAKAGINIRIIHGTSVFTAVPGLLGLSNYKFGRTTTIPYPEENYFPKSPYEMIVTNREAGLHTLVLLDIQEDRDRYMSANEGLEYLQRIEAEENKGIAAKDSLACVVARAGSGKPVVRADTVEKLLKEDFGGPLHALVIPAQLHFMEAEALKTLAGAPASVTDSLVK